jgi:cytochrome c-type biogenesis protein
VNEWVEQAVGGSVLLALPVALLAGLVSFFSPCVLPLLPGYLSYATGLGSAELAAADGVNRRRVLAGTLGFVAGLALVFVASGALAGSVGAALVEWQRGLSVAAGVLAILLGLLFTGWLPLQASWRPNVTPRLGVAAAPLLGIVFALGWTPCVGPALSVVLTLALNEGTALRGGVLALAYALGLGLPFVVAGLAFDRLTGTLAWVRRHHRGIQIAGGVAMMVVGLLLVTGGWEALVSWLRQWASGFQAVI